MSGSDRTRTYLVECYWPGVSEGKVLAAVRRARSAASELRRQGGTVEFLGSILVPVDETVFCLFDGIEADVRTASVRAGVPFERVLESLRIDTKQGKERNEHCHKQEER
jgi:hypothetical protein